MLSYGMPKWVCAMQVDWRVSVKPPKLGRGLGSMPGLGSLLTTDDDMDACSAAAQAALSAARLAGYKPSTSGKPLLEIAKGLQGLRG